MGGMSGGKGDKWGEEEVKRKRKKNKEKSGKKTIDLCAMCSVSILNIFFIFRRDDNKKVKTKEERQKEIVIKARSEMCTCVHMLHAPNSNGYEGRITHSLSGKHFSLPPPCEKLRFLRF